MAVQINEELLMINQLAEQGLAVDVLQSFEVAFRNIASAPIDILIARLLAERRLFAGGAALRPLC